MSAAAEPVVVVVDGDAPAAKPDRGRRKLIAIAAATVLLAGAGGGAAWTIRKRRAAAEQAAPAEGEDGEAASAHAEAAHREVRKTPPAFLPLDNFVVNLADRGSERYAQIGITLELEDAKYSDQLKAYMPAIRNGILMVLAHKTSQELLTRTGKEKLADEVMRAAVRPLGIELEGGDDEESRADGAPPRAGRTPLEESPVRHVHFSSFIIQ